MIKVNVFGDRKVGKSSLISCFVHGRFDPYNKSGIGVDFQSVFINFGTDRILTQFHENSNEYFHCVIAVYDVTSKDSYASVCSFLDRLEKKSDANSKPPVLLIGNKADLIDKRCVTRFEAELLALQYEAMHFEISCYHASKVREEIGSFILDHHSKTFDPLPMVNLY